MSAQDPTVAEPNEPAAGADEARELSGPSLSFSRETWKRFRKSPRSMLALGILVLLFALALFAPCIAGTKPIVCRYKGSLYFPAISYYPEAVGRSAGAWENPVFTRDKFRGTYPANLKKKDSESW